VNVTGTTYADGGAWWSFAVSATPPLFGKLAPANGATDLGSSVTLQWSPVADAGYYVCWDTSNNNACDGDGGRTAVSAPGPWRACRRGPTTGRSGGPVERLDRCRQRHVVDLHRALTLRRHQAARSELEVEELAAPEVAEERERVDQSGVHGVADDDRRAGIASKFPRAASTA